MNNRSLNKVIGLSSPVVLASASPRRKALLDSIGLDFTVVHPQGEEKQPTDHDHRNPADFVMQLANDKAQQIHDQLPDNCIYITADTVVFQSGRILGKPESVLDADLMLRRLSGSQHFVFTGYKITSKSSGQSISDFSRTLVRFNMLNPIDIQHYVNSGAPMDKAGGYGIQDDMGAVFVKRIDGDYFNVVGLPVNKIFNDLKLFV